MFHHKTSVKQEPLCHTCARTRARFYDVCHMITVCFYYCVCVCAHRLAQCVLWLGGGG